MHALIETYVPVGQTANAKVNKLKKQVEALKEIAKGRGIKALPIAPPAPVAPALAPAAGIAALDAPAKSKFIIRKPDFDPKKVIEDLSVYQARALYVELKEMFGA